MRRNNTIWLLVWVFIALISLTTLSVGAEDFPTEENGEVKTENVLAVNSQSLAVIGTIALLLLYDAIRNRRTDRLLMLYEKVLSDKATQEKAQQLYIQSSLSIQDFVKLISSMVDFVASKDIVGIDGWVEATGDFLDNVKKPVVDKEQPPKPVPDTKEKEN